MTSAEKEQEKERGVHKLSRIIGPNTILVVTGRKNVYGARC